MRPNRYVILVSILLGAFGAWFTADAVGQYLNTARSFAAVDAHYVEDSFRWLDPNHEEALADFVIVNDSDNDARLSHFGLSLFFDGEFAGARYRQWEPVDVPAGESVQVEIHFQTSITRVRDQGSDAELSVRGRLRLDFEGIERDMTVRTSGTLGRVPYEEPDE